MTRFTLFAAVVCLASTGSLCRGQGRYFTSDDEPGTSSLEQRLTDLEAEVQTLRAANSSNPWSDTCDSKCGTCCSCCSTPRFEAGAEVAFLAPHSTTGLGPSGIAAFPTNELFASWRTWLSYSLPNKLGLRARYWEFDHQVTNSSNVFTYGLDAYVVDLELTYRKSMGSDCDLLLSGGVRHVSFHEDRTFLLASQVDCDLTGIVVGGELTRNLFGGLQAYGITRGAAVFGDTTGEVPANFVIILDNTYAFMWEAQLGLELCRETRIGQLAVRVGAEVQHWDSITYKFDAVTRDSESIGLVGVVTGLTLRR